jgi:hypothetical protein
MHCFFVWAVICGTAITEGAGTTPPHTPREWVDASGTRRARAVLLRIEGDTLWLRRNDGKLSTTNISNLSQRDRQYVAALSGQPARDPEISSVPSAVIEKMTDYVETIQQLPGWFEQNLPDVKPALVPAALVYVRVSRGFLEEYVERSVHRQKPVRDCILGARILGHSQTRGVTRLALIPSNADLRANIMFDGSVRARTRGYKGPVVLHNIADSTFRARKLISLDDDFGLRVAPSTAKIATRLRTTGITTSLPRLRGRIATRIAWRRVSRSHGRAEAITADHTADDIRSDLDARINRSMAHVQRVFGSKIPELETGRSPLPTDVRFRCRTEYLEMALIREDATAEERRLRPPPAHENSDVSVRVHRTLFTSAIADPQLLQNVAPFFEKLLQARAKQQGDAKSTSDERSGESDTEWAINLEWVSLDFNN